MQIFRERESRRRSELFSLAAGGFAILTTVLTPSLTETAVANGDTRTINLYHTHTQESISATYLVNGRYDQAVLQQLNWFLRDWRRDEPTNMDPRLFDVVWESYRSAGAGDEVVRVVSAYRSPETNAMLRARSRAVAKYSQHMLGRAMDTTLPGMPMSRVREIGMRMQRGGVGYYPSAGTPFVHLDVGGVRSWPRMTYDQLLALFPDGKTVHLPSNGQPLARYEEARAEIEERNNGAYVAAPSRTFGGFLASLFGGGAEEDEDAGYAAPAPSTRKQWAALAPRMSKAQRMAAGEEGEEGGAPAPETAGRRGADALANAQSNLPRGETVMSAPPAEEAAEQAARLPEKTRFARAPLPPRRPASLEKPLLAETAGGAVSTASLDAPEGSHGARPAADGLDARANREAASAATPRADAPRPPRRPASLADLSAPASPAKPAGARAAARVETKPAGAGRSAASHALADLMDTTGSTPRPKPRRAEAAAAAHGGEPADTERPSALAYAPGSKGDEEKPRPEPEEGAAPPSAESRPAASRPAAVKPADSKAAAVRGSAARRSSAAAPAAAPRSGATVLGSSIAGLRSAARAAEPK